MPNHYDTCREGYCGICGQAQDKKGKCLDKLCVSHKIKFKEIEKMAKKANPSVTTLEATMKMEIKLNDHYELDQLFSDLKELKEKASEFSSAEIRFEIPSKMIIIK